MGFLRFILAITVVSAHSEIINFLPLQFARMFNAIDSVKIFFVISGFFMGLVLSTKYLTRSGLKAFYLNRFLRLYPAYFVILVLTLLCTWFTPMKSVLIEWAHLPVFSKIYTALANFTFFGQDWLYFMHRDGAGHLFLGPQVAAIPDAQLPTHFLLVAPAWTLGMECVFYLLAPFLVRLPSRLILGLIVGIFTLKHWLFAHYALASNPWHVWQYRFFPFEFPFFLIGIIGYRIFRAINQERTKLFGYLALLVILIYPVCRFPVTGLISPYGQLVICLIPLLFLLTRNNKWDAMIGELSYPIYIGHFFLRSFLVFLFPHCWETRLGFGGGLLVYSILFSLPLIFIEKYFNKWRTEIKTPANKPQPETLVLALADAGVQ